MDIERSSQGTSRRNFLALMGIAAGASVLPGCGEAAERGGTASDAQKAAGVLPKYTELQIPGMPPPDVKGTPPLIADGYLKYPELVQGVTEKVGAGGPTIKAMTPAWAGLPNGAGKNAYLDGINAQLGVVVDFSTQDGLKYTDKLNAILGARDVPDVLAIPGWEVPQIPRMSEATKALFEDLTPYLAGDAVTKYPMLATLPTGAWNWSVWSERLYAVPFPTSGPFPWALYYRKDLFDKQGIAPPKTADELYQLGKQFTDASKNLWAFNDVFDMVQMIFKVPNQRADWSLDSAGKPVHRMETPEFKAAVEFMNRLYKEGMVHPDVIATEGTDPTQLFGSGKIVFMMNGIGSWQATQADQQKVTPGFNIQAVPVFAADGGTPVYWGDDEPTSFTFIKKGLGQARVEEILRVINWSSAVFGTKEAFTRDWGFEGKHYKMTDSGPVKTDLAVKENASQYTFIGGGKPTTTPSSDTPNYPTDLIGWSNNAVQYLAQDPWAGTKFELPARFVAIGQPTEDKITDVLRGRRPLSDVDTIVQEWRAGGGDEGRELMAKALENKPK